MAERRSQPRVFTIPSGAPFLNTLADALLARRLVSFADDDPLALADVTVLLPTRRAVRAFREVLIARLRGAAAVLPAIRPIGDVDEEDHLLAPAAATSADLLVLPPAISRLDRRLILTALTLQWGRVVRREQLALAADEPLLIPASAADATRLAGDLARLIDDMETAGVAWQTLRRLVPEEHAHYFQITLDFLKIVAEGWPAHLAEIDRVDPAARRDKLIRAAADRLETCPPTPVVAAGSTGSIPATAELLKVIAGLPNGAVVLPGLDQSLDEAGWTAIGDPAEAEATTHGHAQFGLKQLIATIGIARDEVTALIPEPLPARTRLISEAMRPAETIERWTGFATVGAEALAGVDLIVARNEREEATAIALAAREVVERVGTTVALVTPDRAIARRVAAELARWGISADDSAGSPLSQEPQGVFARLMAEAAAAPADPIKLLALLKNPFAAFGLERARCRRAARMLELAVFRGFRVAGGVGALANAVNRSRETPADRTGRGPDARRRLTDADWALAKELAGKLAEIVGPLEAALGAADTIPVATATDLLLAALAAAADGNGDDGQLWQGAGGAALARLLTDLIDSDEGRRLAIAPDEYPSFLTALLADVTVQRPTDTDPRIHIWGTLEARLQSVDLMILAGLDEDIWPAATRTDPWLSRIMRAEIGLPPPERRIGLAAHDFVEGMSAPGVIVTRAEKRGGVPTIESRWLQRLGALAGDAAMSAVSERGQRYVALARSLDRMDRPKPVARPEPKPPVAERPSSLSITDIETLIRDPYAIYAKRVLRLEPLDPLDRTPDAAERGALVHDALAAFVKEWSGPFDAAAEARLIAIARDKLTAVADFPDVVAVWSLRLAAVARWFVAWEAARDGNVVERHAEIDGALELATPARAFRLKGRADRIDVLTDGSLAIYDFKTGSPPTERQVFAGLTPQMTLEAGMARAGAFGKDWTGASVSELAWLGLGRIGRSEPYQSAVKRGETADRLGERALAMLNALVAAYDLPDRGYLSRARPMMERAPYTGDYDHLARVREWALVETNEDFL